MRAVHSPESLQLLGHKLHDGLRPDTSRFVGSPLSLPTSLSPSLPHCYCAFLVAALGSPPLSKNLRSARSCSWQNHACRAGGLDGIHVGVRASEAALCR